MRFDEGKIDEAVRLMQPVLANKSGLVTAFADALVAARAAEAAVALVTEHAIRGRDRRTYQQAVQHLKRMKAVHKSRHEVSDWNAYLQSLRAQYRHLPALQDEMRQARL